MRTIVLRLSISLVVLCCLPGSTCAQQFSGFVGDESGAGLPLVNVSLPALHLGAVTDDSGRFNLGELRSGVFTVEFTILGYGKETRTLSIESDDVAISVTMHQTALELPGVIVTGRPQPTDVLSSSQSVSVVGGRELSRLRGQNVMQALSNTPGVSVYSTGAGIAKPVIRGLTSQRVLVVSDGVRQEGQQWGDEHAPEIDAFDVERIEVLRGPGSVLYGSDALGGVVNVIKHEVPSVEEGFPNLGGNLTLNGFSNNRHTAGDLSLEGAAGVVGYRGHLSVRNAGDVTTPDGRLFNSGLEGLDGGGLFGVKGDWGAASIDYSHFGQEIQIHEDPAEDPLATPYQKIRHEKVHIHGDFSLENIRLETDGSWQNNVRREFEEKDISDPALHLRLNSYSLDVKGHHQPVGSIFGTVGFSLQSQRNETLAEEKLIPGFNQINLAGFLYEEARLGRFILSAGLRYDTRTLKVDETPDLGVNAQTRDFNAFTGNTGFVYRAADALAFTLNVGTGWRSPTAFELFVDGVHEGTVQYLIGDNTLNNEQSLNVDLSARYVSGRMKTEVTFFQNTIDNYIYASPTESIDTASGFQKYLLKQSDATLTGAEVSLEALLADWLVLTGGFDYLRGTNDVTSRPLPLTPANRIRTGIRITHASLGGISNPYITVDVRSVFSQKRVEVFETSTAGYTLFDLGVGGELSIGARTIDIDLSVKNLFDKSYRDHLNRFKEYSLNPGRDLEIKVSVPFVISGGA